MSRVEKLWVSLARPGYKRCFIPYFLQTACKTTRRLKLSPTNNTLPVHSNLGLIRSLYWPSNRLGLRIFTPYPQHQLLLQSYINRR